MPKEDIPSLIEKLATLKEKGHITDEEYSLKKNDLLFQLESN